MDPEVVALWERAAASYETETPYFTLMGARIVQRASLAPSENVLDIACGKGATLVPAARAVGASGSVIGIDIVPAMVRAARENARAAGLDNVDVVVMDGEALDFAPATFDVAISAFGLGFLRPARALPEIRRVLRDGGRFVTSLPAGGGPNWDFFGDLCGRYGLTSSAHPGGTRIPSPTEMAELFAAADFRLDPPVRDVVSTSFADEEAWWRWAWSHGQRAFLERLPESEIEAFKADAFTALRSFASTNGIPLDQEFLVVTAHA